MEQLLSDGESLAIVCLSIVGIVAILVFGIGATIATIVKTTANTRLKQQMLERGMSPAEIEQVIKAGSDELKKKWHGTEKTSGVDPKGSIAPGS